MKRTGSGNGDDVGKKAKFKESQEMRYCNIIENALC